MHLSGDGHVLFYSAREAALSGLDRSLVVGRHFFRDVAPCASVREFGGRLDEMRASGRSGREEFPFVFRFKHATVFVDIVLVYDAEADTAHVLVRKVGE